MSEDKFKAGNEMKQELIKKYSTILPDELIEIWKKYGCGSLMDGYFRIINPDDYQELLNETYFRGKISIPILVTAFGDIITLEEGEYIGLVKYKYGIFSIITKFFDLFLSNLNEDIFINKYLEIPQYMEAKSRLGTSEHDECFGYVPLLGLGGSEKAENLKKVKTREHIAIISQLVGKIGM